MIVTWEWTPFATLIILTSLQSLDREQLEAARWTVPAPSATFSYVVLPHLARTLAVVAMIETIFFLGIYAEISVTTVGGPGWRPPTCRSSSTRAPSRLRRRRRLRGRHPGDRASQHRR